MDMSQQSLGPLVISWAAPGPFSDRAFWIHHGKVRCFCLSVECLLHQIKELSLQRWIILQLSGNATGLESWYQELNFDSIEGTGQYLVQNYFKVHLFSWKLAATLQLHLETQSHKQCQIGQNELGHGYKYLLHRVWYYKTSHSFLHKHLQLLHQHFVFRFKFHQDQNQAVDLF